MLRHCLLAALVLYAACAAAQQAPALRLIDEAGGVRLLTPPALASQPRAVVVARSHDGALLEFERVPAAALLSTLEPALDRGLRGELLARYVVAEAADGYRVVFALADFEPTLAERTILVADRVNGEAFDQTAGPLRLIVPGDQRQSRWVRQLTTLRVVIAPK